MPDTPDAPAKVSADEFRALLKIAGLNVSEDRAPSVLDELNAQLAMANTLDRVLDKAPAPTFAPFDPAFPNINLKDEQE